MVLSNLIFGSYFCTFGEKSNFSWLKNGQKNAEKNHEFLRVAEFNPIVYKNNLHQIRNKGDLEYLPYIFKRAIRFSMIF